VGRGCQGVPAGGDRAHYALVAVADARAATGGVATRAGVAARRVGVAETDVKVSEVTAASDDEGGLVAMAAVAAAAFSPVAAAAEAPKMDALGGGPEVELAAGEEVELMTEGGGIDVESESGATKVAVAHRYRSNQPPSPCRRRCSVQPPPPPPEKT